MKSQRNLMLVTFPYILSRLNVKNIYLVNNSFHLCKTVSSTDAFLTLSCFSSLICQSVRQMILSIIFYANTNISRAQEFFWLNHPQMVSIRRQNGKIKNSMGATPSATNPNFRRESSFWVFLHICSISAKTAENFGMRHYIL